MRYYFNCQFYLPIDICLLILRVVFLQEKKLLDLPKLLDICAIYGHENEDLTSLLVSFYVHKNMPITKKLVSFTFFSYVYDSLIIYLSHLCFIYFCFFRLGML